VEIKLAEVKDAVLYIDNIVIEGKICDIDKKEGRISFELKPGSPLSTAEMGKKAEVFFECEGHKYFISGKTFFQPPSRVLITTDTDIDIDKRKEKRIETPALPATISCTQGVFHKKHVIKSTIINLSMKGAKVETSEPLNRDIQYEIETHFPYHHSSIEFRSSIIVKHCLHYRNIFINGIVFININVDSENNLKKYLFGEKKQF